MHTLFFLWGSKHRLFKQDRLETMLVIVYNSLSETSPWHTYYTLSSG